MSGWIVYLVLPVTLMLASTAVFFFTVTRGALLWRGVSGRQLGAADHVYPVYSNRKLIRLVDFQPLIAAILLFQYDRLVSVIVAGIERTSLVGKEAMITSCAFGNVMPRVVKAACKSGAEKVVIADIIQNELDHAQIKLRDYEEHLVLRTEDATALVKTPANSVAVNVIFFLLHELPHHLKQVALQEAVRVLEPGGTLYLAEFHRPDIRVMRTLSWAYFKVFEPLGLALWDSHDPLAQLEAMENVTCDRRTMFFGNFQVITATKSKA